jgi:hypothetical protein
MKRKYDKLWIGLLSGILVPLITLFLYYKISYSFIKIDTFLFKMFVSNIFTPLLSLCVVVNLGLFFIFINKTVYYAARGVIMATLFYAIIVFALKLALE